MTPLLCSTLTKLSMSPLTSQVGCVLASVLQVASNTRGQETHVAVVFIFYNFSLIFGTSSWVKRLNIGKDLRRDVWRSET